MSAKPPVTMASLGLTPGEAELFTSGAHHLFGHDQQQPEEVPPPTKAKPAGTPKPKPSPKKAPAKSLEGLSIGGSPKAGVGALTKKSKGL